MSNAVVDDRLNDLVTRHMRTDFVHVQVHHTVGEALAHVRETKLGERIVYFYVVDEQQHLLGVVPTRRLLLSSPETPIREIMVERVIAVPESATLLDACEFFLFHRLLAFPVVDAERRILGVIDVELYTQEMGDLAHREESNDVFQLIGVRLAQVQQASIPAVFRLRFPWLLCNIAGGLACAAIAGIFQEVLDQVIVLALFIPVVLALAESVSIQSLSLTLQAQHSSSRINWRAARRSLLRELPIGLLLGLGCGAIVAVTALVWQRQAVVAFCLLAGIALSVTTATLLGLFVPTLLRALQRDPKVASGPITLAATDVLTLVYYLSLSAWLLG